MGVVVMIDVLIKLIGGVAGLKVYLPDYYSGYFIVRPAVMLGDSDRCIVTVEIVSRGGVLVVIVNRFCGGLWLALGVLGLDDPLFVDDFVSVVKSGFAMGAGGSLHVVG